MTIKRRYNIIMILLIIIFLGSGYLLCINLWESRKFDREVEELNSLRRNAAEKLYSPINSEDGGKEKTDSDLSYTGLTEAEDSEISTLQPLKELNSDFAGWLLIPETKISYPVMQTVEEPFFYIDKDYDKNNSKYGIPFLAADCELENSRHTLLIYGHHMKDGRMFGTLKEYENREYFEAHPVICFETLKEKKEYQIFSVFKTTVSKDGFPYYDYIDLHNADDFADFIKNVTELALYNTDKIPEYGSRLLMLSTCEYSAANGRLVIAAYETR